jgi:VRR-NUC domain
MVKVSKPFTPSEDHESVSFANWLELKISEGASIEKFSHLPLETHTSPIQAKRLQRMGVRRGVPDYLIVVKNRIVFIELKRAHGGQVSPAQTAWLDALGRAGAVVAVCEGASEAKKLISNLLDA